MTDLGPIAALGKTLYKEVQRQMLAALSAGEWKPGTAIPAEKKLAERYGISIGTLRKAIDELVADNILIRHQGRGTYVATHTSDRQFFHFFNVVPHAGPKKYPDVELIAFAKEKADQAASDKLGIAADSKVFRFTNLLSLNGVPILLDDIAVPERVFGGLTEARLRQRPSTLYNFYQSAFGLNVIRTEERLRAVPASAEHARLLRVKTGMPLIAIRRVAFTYHDQPIEWRISYVNTAHYEYLAPAAQ